MTLSARELLSSKARTEDGAFPVRQLYFMPETWHLRYAVIDTGGWFQTDEVLVHIDRFGVPNDDGWPLRMAGDEIAAAPRVDETKGDVTSLPPLVVGPFGNTFSPLMFAAVQADDTATEGPPPEPDERPTDGTGRIFYMEKVGDWLDIDAFGDHGSLGRIDDLRIDDNLDLTHAILSDGTEIALSRFRRMADQGHALFD